MDAQGRVHVAYYDAANRRLKYAYKNTNDRWQVVTLVGTGFDAPAGSQDWSEPQIDLALDQFGDPHIAYTSVAFTNAGPRQELHYLYSDPGVGTGYWSPVELVGCSAWLASPFSMAVQPGVPPQVHVAYSDAEPS